MASNNTQMVRESAQLGLKTGCDIPTLYTIPSCLVYPNHRETRKTRKRPKHVCTEGSTRGWYWGGYCKSTRGLRQEYKKKTKDKNIKSIDDHKQAYEPAYTQHHHAACHCNNDQSRLGHRNTANLSYTSINHISRRPSALPLADSRAVSIARS